jgi:putative aldouronate transport system substrate-binding protein
MDLYLASGDMPDIMMYRDPDAYMLNYGDGSRALNLLDYAEYMPGYIERRKTYPHLSLYDTADGKAYIFLTCKYDAITEVWYANTEQLNKYGLSVPKNYEEMKAAMKTVHDADPTVDGVQFLPWGFGYIFCQYNTLFGGQGIYPNSIAYDYDKSEWVYPLTTNETVYKNTTIAMAEAYQNGWLNPDIFTGGEWYDTSRVSGNWLFWNIYFNEANIANQEKNGWPDGNITYLTTPAAEGVKPYYATANQSDTTGWVYTISNTTKHPEICAQILELVTSKEYGETAYWGFEGVTYEIGADGKRRYTEEYLNADLETQKAKWGIARSVPYYTDPMTSSVYYTDALILPFLQPAKDALADAGPKLNSGEYATYYSAYTPKIDDLTKEDIAVITAATGTYIEENLTGFILGTKPLSEWDSFIAGLSSYGDINWAVEQYNKAEQKPLRALPNQRTYMLP